MKLRSFIVLLLFACSASALSVQRFPPPEFETDYTIPTMTQPAPQGQLHNIVDLAVLIAAISIASWLALKKRSRKFIVSLMLFSLLYFGFWRKGCICPIGAIGNITLGVFDSSYAIPFTAAAFFFLPLIFTLFFGRTFCGGVCPMGAAQDAVLIHPVKMPAWLEAPLRLFAWLFLSLAVFYAAMGSMFIICKYDPFVAFFRFSANPAMWVISIAMIVLAMFVGRPYCRFLCPLGVLLRQAGRLSLKRVTITPDECIHCRLCQDACPFNAIEKPTADWPATEHHKGRRRLLVYILMLPVFIAAGAWLGYLLHPKLAGSDPIVSLARQVRYAQISRPAEPSDEIKAFESTGKTPESLYRSADAKLHGFAIGSSIVGGWMGFVAAGSLIINSIFWRRTDYTAHRAGCFACGRCFDSCPRHRIKYQHKPEVKKEELILGA